MQMVMIWLLGSSALAHGDVPAANRLEGGQLWLLAVGFGLGLGLLLIARRSRLRGVVYSLSSLGLLGLLAVSSLLDAPKAIQAQALAQSRAVVYADVQPIFQKHCVGCHQAGGIAPFSLERFEDAAPNAKNIADVTDVGYMPPWMPSSRSPKFVGERRLSPEEKTLLDAWARAGAPKGELTPVSVAQNPRPKADLVLTPKSPYTPNGKLKDDYRCFVFDPKLQQDKFVSGFFVTPGERSVVHHVILFRVRPQDAGEILERDRREAGEGYTCFGGATSDTAGGWIGGWVPGSSQAGYPTGTGMKLEAGGLIVMQIHYNLANGTKPDRSSVDVRFANEAVTELRTALQVAPVEIPCPSNLVTPACQRQTTLERNIREDGMRARTRVQGLLTMCGKNAADYQKSAGDASHVSTDCERRIVRDGIIYNLMGHLHTRGTSFKLELNPDTPKAQILLEIPAWSFHWQDTYQLQTPIRVERGDRIRVTCTYNNTRGNQPDDLEPRYVLWGEGTSDEMCLGVITTSAQ
jgi:mono/diheme cytochrome c family protein